MILNDRKIECYVGKKTIGIEPYSRDLVQPHSYDLTLGNELKIPWKSTGGDIHYDEVKLPYELSTFALGTTIEHISLPDNICAQVDGKSTLGRLGLSVHQTAGWIDAGFNGNITLELNPQSLGVELKPGMKIAQIVFFESEPAEIPYGHPSRDSHYQNQSGVTEPRGVNDLY